MRAHEKQFLIGISVLIHSLRCIPLVFILIVVPLLIVFACGQNTHPSHFPAAIPPWC